MIARRAAGGAALGVFAALSGGCGLGVRSADLFQLTRTGAGRPLTIVVNDSGTISCNGAAPKPLSDHFLLQARSVATELDRDAKLKLALAPRPGGVFSYVVRLQDGMVSFGDTAAIGHIDLARAELFAAQVATQACGLRG